MGFPKDWPAPGPIDLKLHDLPHRSSTTEWWYVNSHFETPDGRQLSLFAAFFRIALGHDEKTKKLSHAHALTWALSDRSGKTYVQESRLDHAAPHLGLERVKNGRGARDPRLNRAITEILEKGRVPEPDRMFGGEVFVNQSKLELDYAGARFEKRDDGSYALSLAHDREHLGCELVFAPQKAPIRHGDDGVVRGQSGEEMFYYFIPRCALSGTVTMNGSTVAIKNGQGWYDHEFGGDASTLATSAKPGTELASKDRYDAAWNWVAVQLDDGTELSAYALYNSETKNLEQQWAVEADRAGGQRAFHDFILTPHGEWRSTRTFHDYPVAWRLAVPELDLDLHLKASFADQEFITVLSDPAFWEGCCEVTGTRGGKPVRGLAYLERSGFETLETLDDFFGAVGEVVRDSVASILPFEPTFDQARDLVASQERAHYMDGVDIKQFSRTMIKPIREITDRGGKSWRSYAALACCDVVGGDSRRYTKWLAMPEFMHVGSLIVDDVQDRSDVRRGGPACHKIYGEPLAINAGTAAYFMGQKLLVGNEVSSATKLRLYDLYFEALRAGHAGQALDLDGLGELMAAVVESGDASLLERRVLATHRLKTAAPAGALARMGALVGGGSEEQIEAVGRFFEALGLAFQMVDDVLNLRGFKGKLKAAGEDVGNGTITLPVAKAMGLMGLEDRRWLRDVLATRPKDDQRTIDQVVAKMESVGAITATAESAREMVEAAWAKAEPLLVDSVPKIMLRAFGWYVLDRHY